LAALLLFDWLELSEFELDPVDDPENPRSEAPPCPPWGDPLALLPEVP
jgi:hypothetical protein